MMDLTALDDDLPEIFSLPPEAMLSIFSHCPEWDLISSIQFVCSRWQELVMSERAWRDRELVFKNCFISHKTLKLVCDFPFLTAVSFENCSGTPDLMTVILKHCCNISTLKAHIRSRICLISLHYLKTLTRLDLCLKWDASHLQTLYYLPAIPSIDTIVLRKFCFKDSLAVHLIQECTKLQHIIVTKYECVEDYIMMEIQSGRIKEIVSLQPLQTVYVSSKQHLSKEILIAVSKFKTLCHVVLNPTNYSNEDMNAFLFGEPLEHLVTLDLGYSSCVSDYLLRTVSQNCPNIRTLVLTRCDIGDEAMKHVTNALFKIEKLNLHGTNVSMDSLRLLPVCLPNLTDLCLLACRRVRKDDLSCLVHKMPNLLIVLPRIGTLTGYQVLNRASPFLTFRNSLE